MQKQKDPTKIIEQFNPWSGCPHCDSMLGYEGYCMECEYKWPLDFLRGIMAARHMFSSRKINLLEEPEEEEKKELKQAKGALTKIKNAIKEWEKS